MPAYYSKEQFVNMFINSEEEIINSYDLKLNSIKSKVYNISIYSDYQKHHIKNNLFKFYHFQVVILRFTNIIANIIYPVSNLNVTSIITNKLVSIEEESSLIQNKIKELNIEFNLKKINKSAKKFTNKLKLAQFNKLLPIDIIENVAIHLASKRPSKKRVSTNWQNFCKQRKNSGFNYKDNSFIWNSLDYDIKNKYKNPYYKHF